MKFANPFAADGVWLKGNTHAHSTCSDGEHDIDQIAGLYSKKGYDFVCVTDHWLTAVPKPIEKKGLLLLPGLEFDFKLAGQLYHVVCLNPKRKWKQRKFRSLNELIKLADEDKSLLIMAHPYWLGARSQCYMKANHFCGIEVYNTICDSLISKGYSNVHWDDLLDSGKRIWGFAADDLHSKELGYARGWVMVKAKSTKHSDIINSLRKGMFYSTQGPQFKDISIKSRTAVVKTSPAVRINMICNRYHGAVKLAEKKPLNKVIFEIPKAASYARFECIDKTGKTAWSNPVFF